MPRNAPLLLAILCAGCLSPAGGGPGPLPDPAASPQGQWLNGTLDGLLTEANVLDAGVSSETPCQGWARSDVRRVLGGRATATWNATSPLGEELVLVAGDGRGPPYSVQGRSPLRLEVAPMDVPQLGYKVGVRAPSPGVVREQPVHVEWAIRYEGSAAPGAHTVNC